jgi:hypothetical protein
MKDWLVTAMLAVAALAAFYTLLATPSPEPPKIARPLTTEPGPNGYMGLVRWLRAQGLTPIVWRDRFNKLDRVSAPPRGNLLISTAPHVYPLRNSEFAPLRRWIEAGNTLLLVASLSDSPDWAPPAAQQGAVNTLEGMTGLKLVPEHEAVAARAADSSNPPRVLEKLGRPLAKPTPVELVPEEFHPLLEGVTRVQAVARFQNPAWTVTPATTSLALELASSPQLQLPVLWLAQAGRGQILVSALGSVFTNDLLGKADNARLLANVVRWSLQGDGRVLIDDAHQGSVEYYDPEAFFGDTRLHATLLWMVALWLAFVLGPQRMRLASVDWRPADLTTFVRAIGGFTARVLEPAATARQMFSVFFAEVHRRTGLPPQSQPPWEWLHAHSGADAAELTRLRQLYDQVQRDRRVNLQQLHNLLMRVRSSWLQH